MTDHATALTARVIRPDDCDTATLGATTDQFFIDGESTHGRVSLVGHVIAPRSRAAPMHLHEREDEFSFIMSGQVAAISGDRAAVGDRAREQLLDRANGCELSLITRGARWPRRAPGQAARGVAHLLEPR